MLEEGYRKADIARKIGRSKSTITREIKRGTTQQIKANKRTTQYLSDTGETVYKNNRRASKKPYKAIKAEEFLGFVSRMFHKKKWSIDAICGYAKTHLNFPETLSTKTIYNYIELELIPIKTTDLPEKIKRNTKTKRVRKNKKRLGESIESRPDISLRDEFGHWEIDTVIGIKNKEEQVLLTLVERMTRQYIAIKIDGKTANAVTTAIESIKEEYGKKFGEVFKTITSDNGLEFTSLTETLKEVSTKVYFTHPYSSYERGTNERHNGILRRFIPKGKSITNITESVLNQILDWINGLPRKILGYSTPEQLFERELDRIYAL